MIHSIALVGLMGVGKTSIGKRLAPKLGLPFFDADWEIEQAAEMKVADIFELYGEAEFRRLEQRVIERLLAEQPCVLATGGGAYIQPGTHAALNANAIVVWLDAQVRTLVERTRGRTHRPLLNQGNHADILTKLKHERDPHYAKAQVRICSTRTSDEGETVQRLVDALNALDPLQPDARKLA